MEKALKRTQDNDIQNGEYVMRTSRERFDLEVESIKGRQAYELIAEFIPIVISGLFRGS